MIDKPDADDLQELYDPRKSRTENAAGAAKDVLTATYSARAWLLIIGLNIALCGLFVWLGLQTSGLLSWGLFGVAGLNGLETLRQIGMRVFTGW